MTTTRRAIERQRWIAQALGLQRLTIAWNLLEAAASVAAGWVSGSVALTTFGLDSVIETLAATAVLRRLVAELREGEAKGREAERVARRIVGSTLLALAAYVLLESGWTLWHHRRATPSIPGIAVSALALIVMPAFAWSKQRLGERLESRALVADAKESLACAWLAGATLLGVLLESFAGWGWADPVAAMVMVPFLVHEAREAFEGDEDTEGTETRAA